MKVNFRIKPDPVSAKLIREASVTLIQLERDLGMVMNRTPRDRSYEEFQKELRAAREEMISLKERLEGVL